VNKNSITAKISIFFAVFVLLILSIAFGALKANRMHQEGDFFGRVHKNSYLIGEPKQNEDIRINSLDITLFSIAKTELMLKNERPKHRFAPPPPPMHDEGFDEKRPNMEMYGGFFESIVVIELNGKKIALKDEATNTTFYVYFTVILTSVLLAISLLYAAILKSLRPLKELEKEIEAFGFGIKPRAITNYPQNEIGKIQRAFHAASSKISGLLDAREIFLKNAAHELKTPIAKGVIVAHMIDSPKQQDRLLEIFFAMTQIIDGIMTTEELIAKGFSPKIEPILLKSFCEKIRKKLLLEPAELVFDIEPATIIMADSKLLEIALANLFENSVKFKSDKYPAKCTFENGKIFVSNKADALEEPIDKYFEPFFKETSIRNENGMGLGLYLTKKVLEIQGLRLTYQHANGENRFCVG
jgi:two-component system, OmpR family, sensor kinase